MKIRIKETQEVKDLVAMDYTQWESGIEWTADLITAPDFWNSETQEHEMSQDDFDWWSEWIENDDRDQEEIKTLAEELEIDIDIIRQRIDENYTELNNQHETIQYVLNEIRDENTIPQF